MVEHIEKVANYTLLYYGCDVFTLDDEGYFTWKVKELVKNSTEFVDYVMDYDLFSAVEYNYTRIAVEVSVILEQFFSMFVKCHKYIYFKGGSPSGDFVRVW